MPREIFAVNYRSVVRRPFSLGSSFSFRVQSLGERHFSFRLTHFSLLIDWWGVICQKWIGIWKQYIVVQCSHILCKYIIRLRIYSYIKTESVKKIPNDVVRHCIVYLVSFLLDKYLVNEYAHIFSAFLPSYRLTFFSFSGKKITQLL